MHSPTYLARASHSTRLKLSVRGHSSEASYRTDVSAFGGPTIHRDLASERAAWARVHGLEPDDGAYLVELSFRPLTINQLGEALAIYSQTREMVSETVDRLVVGGFLRVVGI